MGEGRTTSRAEVRSKHAMGWPGIVPTLGVADCLLLKPQTFHLCDGDMIEVRTLPRGGSVLECVRLVLSVFHGGNGLSHHATEQNLCGEAHIVLLGCGNHRAHTPLRLSVTAVPVS